MQTSKKPCNEETRLHQNSILPQQLQLSRTLPDMNLRKEVVEAEVEAEVAVEVGIQTNQ
jgi:hypothetical protein